MMLILTGRTNSYAELITVLLIFVVVLGVTALTTKWIAGYQKEMGHSGNIELMDAVRLGNNKYIQVVRVGEKYIALAVCKDTVTVLCEIPEDSVRRQGGADGHKLRFNEILAAIKTNGKGEEVTDTAPDGEKDQDK